MMMIYWIKLSYHARLIQMIMMITTPTQRQLHNDDDAYADRTFTRLIHGVERSVTLVPTMAHLLTTTTS